MVVHAVIAGSGIKLEPGPFIVPSLTIVSTIFVIRLSSLLFIQDISSATIAGNSLLPAELKGPGPIF
jgi:hypothetical protein